MVDEDLLILQLEEHLNLTLRQYEEPVIGSVLAEDLFTALVHFIAEVAHELFIGLHA